MDEFDKYIEEERVKNFNDNIERRDKEYFIDNFGKLIKFKGDMYEQYVSFHSEIVRQEYPNLEYPKDYVMDRLGWIVVGSSCYTIPIIHKEPTQAQLNTLFDLDLLKRLNIKSGEYYIKYVNII